ncbi:MAG TPA: hypothetical protein VMS92_12130 [Mycobacterium sp.]|nr:hypothetical protein [Mycobacterium sp.]
MLGEDLSRRFDYLFEPLDVDESAGNGDDVTHQVPEHPDDDSRWSRRIVVTGIVLATLAVAAATVLLLLQPVERTQLIVTPIDATSPSTPVSEALSTSMPTPTAQPAPVIPPTVSAPAVRTSAVAQTVEPQRPRVQKPTTVASEPARAPMPPPPPRARRSAFHPNHVRLFLTRTRLGTTTNAVGYSAAFLADGLCTRVRRNHTVFGVRQLVDHADILRTRPGRQ